jgi:Carboxypeptidase regulatory-like domain/TonB dependent receptor
VRRNLAALFLILLFVSGVPVLAQSPDGSITGIVLDPDTKSIAGAEIIAVNDLTGVKYVTATNTDGIYSLPNLPPGPYRIQVSKVGFKAIIKPDIVLNVQDALSINFKLPIGASSVVVTVEGGASRLNTTDGSVSTVVDRNFVENMPLNGRSFQDLILLTPGVLTNTPQSAAILGGQGEFSVNGQRTESNYYTVDGVSANIGATAGDPSAASTSGSLPAATALGTTHGLLSLDALEEFRVESSTYSAEYGRNPGGQFSFVTRSGTNQWHGSAFEYVRNNLFDANDWFNDYFHQPEAALRQNDFGGTLGGPVKIPHVYDGKNRTFLFVSYEGLRLIQPQAAFISQVPTIVLRELAPKALQPVLDAFPSPRCPAGVPGCVEDLGNGLGDFVGTWSNSSSIDSYSFRLDHMVNQRMKIFFRYGDVPSHSLARVPSSPSVLNGSNFLQRTYTVGVTSSVSNDAGNEFRLNYSSNKATTDAVLDNFGGAQATDLIALQGLTASAHTSSDFIFNFGNYFAFLQQGTSESLQRQWNLVDIFDVVQRKHHLRSGVDFRRLSPEIFPYSPQTLYEFLSESSVQNNNIDIAFGTSNASAFPIYRNLSAFAEDDWKLSERLNLSVGLRWEVNPAPSAAKGTVPYTVGGDTLSALALAPEGTPLWKTTWFNLAPRFGVAYILRKSSEWEAVARGGAGVFFDTGQQAGSVGYLGPGESAFATFGSVVASPVSFPLSPVEATPPIINPPTPPYTSQVYAFSEHLQLPFTIQWNATVEQSLGKMQVLTISYVGANGRRLIEQDQVNVAPFNPNFTSVSFFENGLTSDYNALQVKFQRHLSRGLEALASYTWAHSIDYGSFNQAIPYERGNSDYDVRHAFAGALSYEFPNLFDNRLARAAFHHWSFDDRVTLRTGFPVTLAGNTVVDPATGKTYSGGLTLVAGQPVYIYGSQCAVVFGAPCPGGRAINPNAFTVPPCDPSTGLCMFGDAPRNFVRGFGASQMDFAVRREFPLYERIKIQFRGEAFNIFNHPNFGMINPTYCSPAPGCTFGQATSTLARSLGGLQSLYQIGGPRSMQFALKLMF